MSNPFGLEFSLLSSTQTRSGPKQATASSQAPSGEPGDQGTARNDKDWRRAWQQALEQAQASGWSSWFNETGPSGGVRLARQPSLSAPVIEGPRGTLEPGSGFLSGFTPASQEPGRVRGPHGSPNPGPGSQQIAWAHPSQAPEEATGASQRQDPQSVSSDATPRPARFGAVSDFSGEGEGSFRSIQDGVVDRTPLTEANETLSRALTSWLVESLSAGGLNRTVVSDMGLPFSNSIFSAAVEAPPLRPVPLGVPPRTGDLTPVAEVDASKEPAAEMNGPEHLPELHPIAKALAPSASAPPELIRLTAEVTAQGIRVWLGMDQGASSDLPAELARLTLHIQQWLAGRGERLVAVICNGREVWRDTLESTKNMAIPQARRPEFSSLPLFIPRKPQ